MPIRRALSIIRAISLISRIVVCRKNQNITNRKTANVNLSSKGRTNNIIGLTGNKLTKSAWSGGDDLKISKSKID